MSVAAETRAELYSRLKREEEAERLEHEHEELVGRKAVQFFEHERQRAEERDRLEMKRIREQIRQEHQDRADFQQFLDDVGEEMAHRERLAYIAPEAVAARKAEAHRRRVTLDNQLWGVIDKVETQKTSVPHIRAEYLDRHPGGADHCACRGHRLWRREIEPGAA